MKMGNWKEDTEGGKRLRAEEGCYSAAALLILFCLMTPFPSPLSWQTIFSVVLYEDVLALADAQDYTVPIWKAAVYN